MKLQEQIEGRVKAIKLNGKFKEVRIWANERNLILGGSVLTQRVKYFEELGELCRAVIKNDVVELKDAIGDCLVVLTNQYAIDEFRLEDEIRFSKNSVAELNEPMFIVNELINASTLATGVKSNTIETRSSNYVEDVVTLMAQLTTHYNTNLVECLDLAYNEIKDRKGHMSKDGSFIKEDK